jgi:hypothetical protein
MNDSSYTLTLPPGAAYRRWAFDSGLARNRAQAGATTALVKPMEGRRMAGMGSRS